MRARVLDRSQGSPIAQLKSTPGFGKVRRYKLVQLERVAGSEDRVIEITDVLKEILHVALIRETSACPSAFPSSAATACLTRSALLDAMIAVAP
jgi:hypothetical protein